MKNRKDNKPTIPKYPDGFNRLLQESKLLDEIANLWRRFGFDIKTIPPTLEHFQF